MSEIRICRFCNRAELKDGRRYICLDCENTFRIKANIESWSKDWPLDHPSVMAYCEGGEMCFCGYPLDNDGTCQCWDR